MYLKGIGTTQNFKIAYDYYLEAQLKDIPEAYTGLGNIYYYGYGKTRNLVQALKYYKIGSQFNQPEALYMYGILQMMPSNSEMERNIEMG